MPKTTTDSTTLITEGVAAARALVDWYRSVPADRWLAEVPAKAALLDAVMKAEQLLGLRDERGNEIPPA